MQTFLDFAEAAYSALQMHLARVGHAWLALVVALLLAGALLYATYGAPPAAFPVGAQVVISEGESVAAAGEALAGAHIIRSSRAFYLAVRLFASTSGVHAGVYRFDGPVTLYTVVTRLIHGETGVRAVRITFPEGDTVRDIAERLSGALPNIAAGDVLALGGAYEGYLFPDTYAFSPDTTATAALRLMRTTFDTKTADLLPDITKSGHSISDIVTMASLVEKEAKTPEDRRIVAGILWHRIALHMPLQVDAVFGYIKNTDTYAPSLDDLSIDSPYNTYTHQGLPPGPIDNPGRDAIMAALHPETTPYLYYLTGTDEQMHYAKTFEEHKANKAAYLK